MTRTATARPIIFSAPMIVALLGGRKTMTRRVINPQPGAGVCRSSFSSRGLEDGHGKLIKMSYAPGISLWVRETWRTPFVPDIGGRPVPAANLDREMTVIEYAADGNHSLNAKTRPSIFMPRWASRLTLEVTGIKIERVQDISCADAISEGIGKRDNSQTIDCDTPNPRQEFSRLWDSINSGRMAGAASWAANPWVYALTFDVRRANIDTIS